MNLVRSGASLSACAASSCARSSWPLRRFRILCRIARSPVLEASFDGAGHFISRLSFACSRGTALMPRAACCTVHRGAKNRRFCSNRLSITLRASSESERLEAAPSRARRRRSLDIAPSHSMALGLFSRYVSATMGQTSFFHQEFSSNSLPTAVFQLTAPSDSAANMVSMKLLFSLSCC